MLSRIVLVGLLPAIMAKPIIMGGESASMSSRSINSVRQYDGNLDGHDLYNPNMDDNDDCGCSKTCTEKEDGVAGVVLCMKKCFKECPDGKNISEKRQVGPGHEPVPRPYEPPAPIPAIPGQHPTNCAMKCDADCHRVGIPFAEFTKCKDSCSAACSGADQSVIVIEKKAVNPESGPESGAPLGTGATLYEGCMSRCHSDCQTLEFPHRLTQCKDVSCEEKCAKYIHIDPGKHTKKRAEKVPRQTSGLEGLLADNNKSTPDHHNANSKPLQSDATVDTDGTTYESCMSGCKSDCMTANAPLDTTECSESCEERCAQFAHADSDIVPRQLGALGGLLGGGNPPPKPAPKTAAPKQQASAEPPQSGPTVGSGFTSYEACMSRCHSDCQIIDMPLHLEHCDKDCASSCQKFAHIDSGKLTKKSEEEETTRQDGPAPLQARPTLESAASTLETQVEAPQMAEAKRAAPLQNGPVLITGAKTYQGCMNGCLDDCQGSHLAIERKRCGGRCEGACSQYATSGMALIGG
ncbi:hypothetical protein F4775DRAFT_146055 [Biscogniauxia sp. FL1348]|nr:hypothetical protein F4775DRAFT_146055 [Biscogniauxia sp. FL1348]